MNPDTKYIFIINPAAGTSTLQAKLVNNIRAALPTERYELHFTRQAGDGTRIAAECIETHKGESIVLFACGGDGTFFEVINGAAGKAPVGVFPCGSGNDFIKNILSPESLLDVEAQINGQAVPLDLIRCNGQYVSNVCNIGFDADIAYNMNRFRRMPFLSGKKPISHPFCTASSIGCIIRLRYRLMMANQYTMSISLQRLQTGRPMAAPSAALQKHRCMTD